MGLSSVCARIQGMRRRLVRGVRRMPPLLRRWVRAVDLWVQDHHVRVVTGMFVLLIAGAVTLLWMDWNTVVGLATDLAPVLTIVSLIASAFLGVIKWFRERRAKRLALRDAGSATVPHARGGGHGGPTSPSGSERGGHNHDRA
ncbi:hypothetical protein ACGF5T_34580 [Streptomyces sp. NPDC047853]|uniref:hypothetical protein n=1 Tax=unclassified Streptomyces TaxID=2593676 RepID=UPI0034564384